MNIFVLDNDFQTNAMYHVDKHVVKMLVEQTQLLCSTYYFTGQGDVSPYKLTHKNHPCAVWVRESLSNWRWLREFTQALHNEYRYRYNKDHKSGLVAWSLPEPKLIDIGLTPFAQAMPDEYRSDDAVTAYRNYYLGEKRNLFSWKNRSVPEWIEQSLRR